MRRIVVALLLFLVAVTALAGIQIAPSIINFLPGQPLRKDIVVSNRSKDQTAYVKVTPYVVHQPGSAKAKPVKIHNPTKAGLLVAPEKLIIPPGQQREVRVMLTKPLGKHDRIYRIRVEPVSGRLNATHSVGKQKSIGLHVVVAYGALVIARPAKLHAELTSKRGGDSLLLQNTGNTNFLIAGNTECDKHSKTCVNIPSKRLYAGEKWQIKLPQGSEKKPIVIETRYADQSQHYTVK